MYQRLNPSHRSALPQMGTNDSLVAEPTCLHCRLTALMNKYKSTQALSDRRF